MSDDFLEALRGYCGKEVVELTIDMENRLALPELRAQPLAGPVANVIVRMVPL